MIPAVMSQIPEDVHLRIQCENHGQMWKMDKLMETICVEVEAREANEASRMAVGKISIKPKQPEWKGKSTSSSLMAGNQNPIQCVYCKGSHYFASCEAVKTVEERRAILIRDGRS